MKTRLPWLLIVLLTAFGLQTAAMPPHPNLANRIHINGDLSHIAERLTDGRSRGVDEPFDFSISSLRRDDDNEIELRAVCILVDFDDKPADDGTYSREHFQSMLFTVGEYQGGSMRDWYLENSYGQVHIIGEVFGWYRMPQDYAYYVDGRNGFGEYPRNAQGLTRDAILAADDDINFALYDNDGDGVVEALFVVHAGPGAEATGSDDDIWSHAWQVPFNLNPDDMRFGRYAMEPEDGRIGVFGHELGHSMFGLPDLYDYNYASAGVGMWTMMAAGSWGGGGRRPVHFDAYSKARIGFVDPHPVEQNRTSVLIAPVEIAPDVYMVWRMGNWGNEYFLVENRRRIGFDQSIPGEGLLIYHVDDSMENNNNPWWPGSGNAQHYKVAVEQADGSYDLEQNNNSGDAGDPWPGITFNEEFGNDSNPNSRDYFWRETDVTICNIENQPESQIRCDILVTPGAGAEDLSLFLFERIPLHHRFSHPDAREDTTLTDEVTIVTQLLGQLGAEIDGHAGELPNNLFSYNVIIYLESWRDGEDPSAGLSILEQELLVAFLNAGGKILLIGPDIATNLQPDTLLWNQLNAVYNGPGEHRDTGNLRRLTANVETRIAGQNFVYRYREECDHYIDRVSPANGSQELFSDQSGNSRGIMQTGNGGFRAILQPFLFGGLVDWGGRKVDLLRLYFQYLRFYLYANPVEPVFSKPGSFQLISAWPNPFNSELRVIWSGSVPLGGLVVLDALGRKVGYMEINPDRNWTTWHPKGLPSGSYYLVPPGSINANPLRIQFIK